MTNERRSKDCVVNGNRMTYDRCFYWWRDNAKDDDNGNYEEETICPFVRRCWVASSANFRTKWERMGKSGMTLNTRRRIWYQVRKNHNAGNTLNFTAERAGGIEEILKRKSKNRGSHVPLGCVCVLGRKWIQGGRIYDIL